MKNLPKLLLLVLLALTLALPTFAADSTVEYVGGAEKFVFPENDDLFANFKGVMPGDVLTQKVKLENKVFRCDYVKLYFRADPHDAENPPANVDADVATMTEFLAQLTAKVEQGGRVIYEGSADGLEQLTQNIYLGQLRYGETTEITITLTVPLELGNEYAYRVGEVDWIFTAEQYKRPILPFFPQQTEAPEPEPEVPDDTQPEESEPDESEPDESTPDESTPDESTPDESMPDESTPEESTPEVTTPIDTTPTETTLEPPVDTTDDAGTDVPKTDDTTEILPYVLMVAIGICGIIAVVLSYRKEKSSKK